MRGRRGREEKELFMANEVLGKMKWEKVLLIFTFAFRLSLVAISK
jgi:hypothetical protein